MTLWPFRSSDEPDLRAGAEIPVEAPTELEDPGRIARLVSAHRRRCGLSQSQLGIAINWSERSVRRLERGEIEWIRAIEGGAQPDAEELRALRALAVALALAVDQLVRPEDVIAPDAVSRSAAVSVRAVETPSEPIPEPVLVPACPEVPSRSRWSAHGLSIGAQALSERAPAASPGGGRTVRPHRHRWCRPTLRVASLGVAGTAVLCTAGLAAAAVTGVVVLHTVRAPQITARMTATATPIPRHPAALPRRTTVVIPAFPAGPAPAPPPPPPSSAALPAVVSAPPLPAAPVAPAPARLAVTRMVAPAVHPQRPAGPAATLSTTLVDFGTVAPERTVSRTVTLTNTGTTPVHLGLPMVLMGTDLETTTDCTGRTLAPGQHCSITLTFAPGGPTRLNAAVWLTDDTPQGREEFDVRGTSP